MLEAKRSLSQNFLVDPNLRRKLVDELAVQSGDSVLEVGPGHGELSELLVERAAHLCLVEKDDRLAELLRARWGSRADVTICHDDVLRTDLSSLMAGRSPYRIISNLPYSITSPLLFRFLDMRPVPVRLVVLVQREVAERIVAVPGSRIYGALSVGIQTRGVVRLAFRINRQAFRPRPRVDSAAVMIQPHRDPLQLHMEQSLRRLTRVAFGRRRKQLQKILRTAPEYSLDAERISVLLAELELDPRARPENLSPGEFCRLARRLDTVSSG